MRKTIGIIFVVILLFLFLVYQLWIARSTNNPVSFMLL